LPVAPVISLIGCWVCGKPTRRLFEANLLDELGWPQPGGSLERMAEMAATHTLKRGQLGTAIGRASAPLR
jgi:hypothetical protein